jgi:cytochrome c oxidase cbb3-type subunit 4
MTGSTYERLAIFAQLAGTLYFAALFIIAVAWVLWPKNRKGFDEAASIPFRETLPMGDATGPDQEV